jgi:hypothetical protein
MNKMIASPNKVGFGEGHSNNFHLPVAREGLLSQPYNGGVGNPLANGIQNKVNGSTSPSLSPSSRELSPKAQNKGGLKTGKLTSILNRNKQNLELNRKGSQGEKLAAAPAAPAPAAPKKQANQASGPDAAGVGFARRRGVSPSPPLGYFNN